MIFYRTVRRITRLYFSARMKIRFEGVHNLPKEGGFLLVMNHQSHLDSLLLHAYCPRLLFTMTKSSAFRNPIMRWVAPRVGAFPTRRYQVDPQSVRMAIRYLEEGKAVGVFPEGERSWDGKLQKLRPGTIRLILKTGFPVIPCGIMGTYEVWPRWGKMSWLKIGPRRPKVMIRYGQAIHFKKYDDKIDRDKKLPDATKKISESIQSLMMP